MWAAIGIYPLAGTDRFILGSPRFADVRIACGTGGGLRIIAHNVSAESMYVGRAQLDGKSLDTPFATYAQLTAPGGALLEVWMVSQAEASAW